MNIFEGYGRLCFSKSLKYPFIYLQFFAFKYEIKVVNTVFVCVYLCRDSL